MILLEFLTLCSQKRCCLFVVVVVSFRSIPNFCSLFFDKMTSSRTTENNFFVQRKFQDEFLIRPDRAESDRIGLAHMFTEKLSSDSCLAAAAG